MPVPQLIELFVDTSLGQTFSYERLCFNIVKLSSLLTKNIETCRLLYITLFIAHNLRHHKSIYKNSSRISDRVYELITQRLDSIKSKSAADR
jgi:hypothetical protein